MAWRSYYYITIYSFIRLLSKKLTNAPIVCDIHVVFIQNEMLTQMCILNITFLQNLLIIFIKITKTKTENKLRNKGILV